MPNQHHDEQPANQDLGPRVLKKVSARIVPFIIVLYFLSFLNRVNVGFAGLTITRI